MGAFVLTSAGGVNVAGDAQAVRGTNIAAYGQERILAQGANIDVYLARRGAGLAAHAPPLAGDQGHTPAALSRWPDSASGDQAMKALLLAGTHSGAGKTTICLALLAALRRRGLTVQAFKVGPDFIDPGHHALASGRPSHNLDGWMLSREENLAIFARHTQDCDVAVVEGVMGLYDGFDPLGEEGSSAQMAKWLGLPVLLSADARAMSRSLAALAQGFARFDPGLTWAGLLANHVGSMGHAALLREAMNAVPELPFLGGLTRRPDLALPERHLGLITAEDGGHDQARLLALADWLEADLDLDGLLASLPEVTPATPPPEPAPPGPPVRLGVARDQAFCFYYPENLRRLTAAGAELVYFSPLRDRQLPPGLHGLYLGGGYPELHAAALAANHGLMRQIADLGRRGLVIYAECGGMMYLGRELNDLDNRRWLMAGLLPLSFGMLPRLRSLGYREVTLSADTPLGPAGGKARGHEFHYSEVSTQEPDPQIDSNVYQATGRRGPQPDCRGYLRGNVLASYVHLHFGSNPALAPALVGRCRANPTRTTP
ncbi:MAG: cobyrinate a,c-diamide synthase [Desulfarculus sp.]|nr:cobyrinate a,c-diamide synthase [Desulfarculus sp.]